MPYADKAAKAAHGRAYYLANKDRIKAQHAEYRAAHLTQDREHSRRWAAENPERSNAIKARYKKAHPDKTRAIARACGDTMTDGYIRHLICKVYAVRAADIPKSLVDAHRELLKLKRAINEKL